MSKLTFNRTLFDRKYKPNKNRAERQVTPANPEFTKRRREVEASKELREIEKELSYGF